MNRIALPITKGKLCQDLEILIKNGFSRKKAIVLNIISGATALLGGLATHYTLYTANEIIPYALALSSSSFIYVALANLVPQMHKSTDANKSIAQMLLIILGISIIYFIRNR